MTAGEWKRSVSVLGEITPAGGEHFRGRLEDTHGAFKHFVQQCRPNVDIDRVANGDHWLASEALALGLVDEPATNTSFAPATARASTKSRPRRGRRSFSSCSAASAARAAADFIVARFGER